MFNAAYQYSVLAELFSQLECVYILPTLSRPAADTVLLVGGGGGEARQYDTVRGGAAGQPERQHTLASFAADNFRSASQTGTVRQKTLLQVSWLNTVFITVFIQFSSIDLIIFSTAMALDS